MVGYAFHYKRKHIVKAEEGEEEIVLGKRRERVVTGRQRREAASSSPSAAAAALSSALAFGWVEMLLWGEFFGVCEEHKEARKSEENIYCVDCSHRMCPHCLARPGADHLKHRLLQIRRYVYQDVVRVHDMLNLLDCSKVQPYIVNSAKVVLLKPRKQSKPLKSNSCVPSCEICHRSIAQPYQYCCIACMVSDLGSTVTVKEPIDCSPPLKPSLILDLTADLEELVPIAPQSFNAGLNNFHRSVPESSTRREHKRKGSPRRSPLL